VLHGFTGSPASVRGVAEALAHAGLAVELPVLPGHGTTVEDLARTRWSHWAAAAEAAYLSLAERCEEVAVVGLSMGGSLACWLAEHHPVAGLVLVNPLVEPDEGLRAAGLELLAGGTAVASGIGSDIAKPGVRDESYDATPIEAGLSLLEAVGQVGADLAKIHCPVLLFSSRQDHVVAPSNGDRVASSVGGELERVWLERSYHVATLDFDRELVEERTVAFVTGLLARVSP